MDYPLQSANDECHRIPENGVPRFALASFEGYISYGSDITEITPSYERTLMPQKMESVGWIAAGVAHEFANLLGTIQGEIGMALPEMSPRAPGRKNLERIEAALTSATGIVKLPMTCAAAGGVSTELDTLDLSFIVEPILGLLRSSIPKRVVVRTTLSRQVTAVRGNLVEIQLAVMNLITNVRLKVAGGGPGMDAETRARIFDEKRRGKGLGLSVVQRIIRSHRGAINVASTPDEGITFEVLLPSVSLREAIDVSPNVAGRFFRDVG